jgi:hypothetical protein
MKYFALFLAFLLLINCTSNEKRGNNLKNYTRFGTGIHDSYFVEWGNEGDSVNKNRFCKSIKLKTMGVIHLKNNLLDGRQVYFNTSNARLQSVESYRNGKSNGLYYKWRRNGTLEVVLQ